MADHSNRVLYETGLVKIGAFRCSRDNPLFENSGPIQNYCFVFPRTAVVIEHDHDRPFVANPNVVTFYNRRDEYRRRPISEAGDRSDWFALRHDLVVDVAKSVAPRLDQGTDQPFQATHALSTARAYAFQRRLFSRIARRSRIEPIEVEEGVLWLLESVLRSAHKQDDARRPLAGERRRRELAHEAKALLSGEFARDLSLSEVAARLDVSVFHLCRVFRHLVGCSLHEYRTQLRLRRSLEDLGSRHPRALVHCALEAGFSSHSHYGAAFKRSFGQTPSSFARDIARTVVTAAYPRA